jgi:hypothetical protein
VQLARVGRVCSRVEVKAPLQGAAARKQGVRKRREREGEEKRREEKKRREEREKEVVV